MVLPDVTLLHSILSYHRCSVVCVTGVEGTYYAKFMGGWHPVIYSPAHLEILLCHWQIAFWHSDKEKRKENCYRDVKTFSSVNAVNIKNRITWKR